MRIVNEEDGTTRITIFNWVNFYIQPLENRGFS